MLHFFSEEKSRKIFNKERNTHPLNLNIFQLKYEIAETTTEEELITACQ